MTETSKPFTHSPGRWDYIPSGVNERTVHGVQNSGSYPMLYSVDFGPTFTRLKFLESRTPTFHGVFDRVHKILPNVFDRQIIHIDSFSNACSIANFW